MNESQMASFNDDLGKLGFVFQFITLAGFHADGLITARLSKVYHMFMNILPHFFKILSVLERLNISIF